MSVITKFVDIIGIRGIIIIIMAGIIAAQHYLVIQPLKKEVFDQEVKISELEGNITKLTGAIDDQNIKIQEAGIKNEKLKKELIDAAVDNAKISQMYSGLLEDLKKKPKPKDCPSAVKELYEFNKSMVKGWNK